MKTRTHTRAICSYLNTALNAVQSDLHARSRVHDELMERMRSDFRACSEGARTASCQKGVAIMCASEPRICRWLRSAPCWLTSGTLGVPRVRPECEPFIGCFVRGPCSTDSLRLVLEKEHRSRLQVCTHPPTPPRPLHGQTPTRTSSNARAQLRLTASRGGAWTAYWIGSAALGVLPNAIAGSTANYVPR